MWSFSPAASSNKWRDQTGRSLLGLTPQAEAILATRTYPGNVRELRNLVERAVALAEGQRVAPEDLGALTPAQTQDDKGGVVLGGSLRDAVETAERASIRAALEATEGAIAAAAARLGISRKNLWEKMRRYGMSR